MVYGRQAEVGAIEALTHRARAGEGGTLLLEGDPGMGKTALLDAASRRATDMRQLRTDGLEAESSLPFSALADLTERLLDGLPTLPAPQAAAIEGALALAPPAPGDRFAVCAGFLGLLAHGAADEPLLVIVDDAQWLDRASSECLGYAARRLDGLAIALLVAVRTGEQPPSLAGSEVDRICLGGLDRAAAAAVLDDADPGLPTSVVDSLIDAAAGNPLALVELPSLLSVEQRRGTTPLDPRLSPGMTLQRAFEQRIARLPAEARRACLVAAAALTPALGPIQAACKALGLPAGALEAAEGLGVVRLSAERVEFDHPLLRGAVYHAAPAAERRSAHRALSEHTDEDARAWHLAAAAVGPDAEAADALDAAADRASSRGAYGAAADALERAARLSESPEARTRRLLDAGLAAAVGGAYDRAMTLMELAEEIDDPATRASVRHPLAMATLNGGVRNAVDTHRMLTEEAEGIASINPAAAAAMHADAGVAAAMGGGAHLILGSAERAAQLLPDDAPPATRCQVLSILGLALVLRGRTAEGRDALDEAGRLLKEVNPLAPAAQSTAFALGGRRCTGQDELLHAEAVALEAAAREAGAIGVFPYYQVLRAESAYRMGRWDAAERDIAEAIEGAQESGQLGSLTIALVIAARMHAGRGREEAARANIQRGMEIAQGPGYSSPFGWGKAALGFLDLSLGRPSDAIGELEFVERVLELAGVEEPLTIPYAPDLVEAYVRVGRAEDAVRVASRLSDQAEATETALAGALAARCEGLVAESSFDEPFERALSLHAEVESPFERARTLLAFGARLHRARRRVEARERLREALVVFEELGASPWVEQARVELRAAGAIDRAAVADPYELTAQEVRVALAVARGAKNREVAAELFLSPKTVEFHLGHVYRKLGIRSRAELATLVAEGALDADHAASA